MEQAVKDVVVFSGHGHPLSSMNNTFALRKETKLLPSAKGGLVRSGLRTQNPPLP